MAARFNVKETCSAWLRLALNRFTVLGTLIILIGIAGGDPFEDFLLGRTVNVSLAWEAFVTNLGAILDNGFVRLALVGLGLFLLQRGAVAVVRADNERAKGSAESAAALVDRDGGNRRQIVGEVRELIEQALSTIVDQSTKTHRNSATAARAAEHGHRLAIVEPRFHDARTKTLRYVELAGQALTNPETLTDDEKGRLRGMASEAREATLRAFEGFGETPQIMMGDGANLDLNIQKLQAMITRLEKKVANARSQHRSALAALQEVNREEETANRKVQRSPKGDDRP